MLNFQEILKKLSAAEILTLLFIFSVGISLIYKYGFYSELGIEWYLVTATPQELLISSISYIFFCLTGIGFGYLSVKFAEKYLAAIMSVTIVIMLCFFISLQSASGVLKGELYLMLNFMTCTLFITKAPTQLRDSKLITMSGQSLSLLKKGRMHKLGKFFTPLFIIIFAMLPFYLVVTQGKNDAKELLEPKQPKPIGGIFPFISKPKVRYIRLKDDKKIWTLIEMRGDKILIKENVEKPIFKIVEYKQVDVFTTK